MNFEEIKVYLVKSTYQNEYLYKLEQAAFINEINNKNNYLISFRI